MRILPVVLLICFLPGCGVFVPLADSLSRKAFDSVGKDTTTETKISADRLAQLKPGMTKQEVSELFQKPPAMVATKGDGSSIATYSYNKQDRGITVFSKGMREFQTVVVQFDSEGRYITHTLSESRVCGSERTGYSAANCEDQTGAK